MTEAQLNTLVVKARNGCDESLAEIYSQLIPDIQLMSEGIWHRLRDATSFEHACYSRVIYEIDRYDSTKNSAGFISYMRARIRDVRNAYLSQQTPCLYETISLDELMDPSAEDRHPYDIADFTEDLEKEVVEKETEKEMAALLAKGDQRRMAILNAWLDGLNNDSQLSSLLAQRLGGKRESHRKFITRFRYECKEALRTYVC